jgi:hypothetical protein
VTAATDGSSERQTSGGHTRKPIILVLIAVTVATCLLRARPPASVRPDLNLLVITLDTTRADRIGA